MSQSDTNCGIWYPATVRAFVNAAKGDCKHCDRIRMGGTFNKCADDMTGKMPSGFGAFKFDADFKSYAELRQQRCNAICDCIPKCEQRTLPSERRPEID